MPIQLTPARPLKPIKRMEPSKVPWTQKFYKVSPAVDANGIPIPQDPPINRKGFWDKPDIKKAVNVKSEKS